MSVEEAKTPRVVLVGESQEAASYLLYRLQHRGCECRFANSYEALPGLLQAQTADLILGPPLDREPSAATVVSALAAAKASWFCFRLIGDRCWWFPVVRFGRLTLGTPALRPSEFIAELDAIVEEIKARPYAPLAIPA